MYNKATFFRSMSTLHECAASGTLAYILEQAESLSRECCTRMIPATRRRLALVLNRQGVVLEIDPVTAFRLGYEPHQMVSQNLYALLPEHRRAYRWARHVEVVRSGKPLACRDQGELGHGYDCLCVPVIRDGRVGQVMVFVAEIREFVEVVPGGARQVA